MNEIIQNRLLADELHSYLPKEDGLINVNKILHKIAEDQPDTGLVYITSTIKNLNNENHFFILHADRIDDQKTYSINEIKSNSLWEIENKFMEIFLNNPGSTKREQHAVLDLYGETLFNNNGFSGDV